jgi:superfamily II DNA helicase RecQ
MPIRFFSIPALAPGEAELELNRFLGGHRVVSIERHLVTGSGGPVWCVAIEYLATGQSGDAMEGRRNRIDYKEVLPAGDFARFSKLRELRKKLAEAEGLPVYTIFTNEQLAAIARQKPQTLTELQGIEGIGDGKSERYGAQVLGLLQALACPPTPAANHGDQAEGA